MAQEKFLELDSARRAFLIYLKDDQAHREVFLRLPAKAHRKGKQHGFDHPQVQLMWVHFFAGWMANLAERGEA